MEEIQPLEKGKTSRYTVITGLLQFWDFTGQILPGPPIFRAGRIPKLGLGDVSVSISMQEIQETWVQRATHSRILHLKNPMDRGDWGAQSKGSQRVRHDWVPFIYPSPALLVWLPVHYCPGSWLLPQRCLSFSINLLVTSEDGIGIYSLSTSLAFFLPREI